MAIASDSLKSPKNKSDFLLSAAHADSEKLFDELKSTMQGLSKGEADRRLQQYGLNQVARKKRPSWWLKLVQTFNSPFNYLLCLLSIISFFTGNPTSAFMIGVMILLSVLLRFWQENHSNKTAEALQAMISNRASAYREGQLAEVPIESLVPGDVIRVSAGDLIPADIRLLESKDLFINQSALTGESFPVEKHAELQSDKLEQPIEISNLCFMGTSVISGVGKALILTTGDATYFGNLAVKVVEEGTSTAFEKGIEALSWFLIRFILAMVVMILLINGWSKGDWLMAFLFALSVGVGLTPEMLPMIITTNLSKGAIRLSEQKVIVKRLSAIQNLGSMDILCIDKTGTLTQNKIILYRHLDLQGQESIEVLKYAYLNSHFQTGLKSLLDEAILKHAEQDDTLQIEKNYRMVDEVPFDFNRRRLSVVINQGQNHLLICKGAVEETLAICNQILDKGVKHPMTSEIKAQVTEEARSLNEDGFRVIAIAFKETDLKQTKYTIVDEKDLILLGYIAFLDPPKETTADALMRLNQLGITVKILTGDNEFVTQKICHTVDLTVQGILLGSEIDKISDAELIQKSETTTIFAKLTPENKQRIISALQKNQHVVGFLGDGINDSLALKSSDIGLSVDNAVDIAKESADIILLEQNLLVLKDGVIEGRKVFGNIIKYIRLTTSSNFGNVISMLGGSFLLPFLPMKPLHILVQNLLYDFSQTVLPFDRVDEEVLAKPQHWKICNIQRIMLCFGPISSIFDYLLFAIMWFVFSANTVEKQSLFQAGWFIEGLLSQTLIVYMIRTRKVPFLQSWPAPQLIIMSIIVMSIGIYLPYSPLATLMGFTPPPYSYFFWLLGILISYSCLTQLVKSWFIKKYGYD